MADPAAATFRIDCSAQNVRASLPLPLRPYRHGWTLDELIALFPEQGIDILDIGAGPYPFACRDIDRPTTVDFGPEYGADVVADVTQNWPFEENRFDFVYMSHVVEHFYPRDRDRVLVHVERSLRPGGLLFIRVPHFSSMQSGGWEHFSTYGMGGVMSLCHGYNPNLPMMRSVSVGVSLTTDFAARRGPFRSIVEKALNRSMRLTDTLLCRLVGGIPEVQFMLQKLSPAEAQRIRSEG